jgi:hypothetical protein
MYSVPHPVSAIRTRIRQEFERHRYVNKLSVVDVLLFQGNADYQVCVISTFDGEGIDAVNSSRGAAQPKRGWWPILEKT